MSLINERAGELCEVVGSGGAPGARPQSHFAQDAPWQKSSQNIDGVLGISSWVQHPGAESSD